MMEEKKPMSAAQMRKACNAKPKRPAPEPVTTYNIEGKTLTARQVVEIAAVKAPKLKAETVRKRVVLGRRTWAEILEPAKRGYKRLSTAAAERGRILAVDSHKKKLNGKGAKR